MIELIPAKDVNTKHTKYGNYANKDKVTKRRIVNKPEFRVRDNKRCFFCGTKDPNRGSCWCEVVSRGRRIHHFLCNKCRQILIATS